MRDTNEETIINKIIPIETIFKVAEYIEDLKDEYTRLNEIDLQKNKNINYNDQSYDYLGADDVVQYTIEYKDGRKLTQSNYNWFKSNFSNPKVIKAIFISFITSYRSKYGDQVEHKHLDIHITFMENYISISCRGKNNDENANRVYYDITNIISNNEERYNATVRNRKLRIQSFCISLGIILSYIMFVIILINKAKLPTSLIEVLSQKKYLLVAQWIAAIGLGNLFGLPYMKSLYKTIIPRARYSHYSKLGKKSVYTDDIERFTSESEVQIGDLTDNGIKREKIEKIYKLTKIIVLVQIAISILLFLILK